jgi:GNAT superfamily N-acetyltransferase
MIAIRSLTSDDLEFAFHLKEQAGWNQTRADWRRFLRLQADGCFLAEWDGQPAGTVVACVFGSVAWIAMMLVEASLRGRGLGRALMERALAYAAEQGAASVRLDATPLGQPLYERLGFRPDFTLTRYAGALGAEPAAKTPQAEREDYPVAITAEEAAPLDLEVVGADRRKLLTALWEEQPGWGVLGDGRVRGYYTVRPGSNAVQIGPCIADAASGPLLLQDAFRRFEGRTVFIDVPEMNELGGRVAQGAGLSPQRRLLRMTRGASALERVERLWASSGPELG